ncbi:epsin-2 isoform X3 [Trichogramma pretiosum]|uniref:epsin-2 isoform X3 n=1 Tax=Trichogramma pretiosum TaxID=7493 RepID=UPI0006C95207|nr:epsin-2 isoform X3 [Trichogramma pretiosum]
MRRQGQDVMQVNLAGIRRDIVNLAHNYSNAQKAVRKATSNDPWGPSSTLMAEIADLTYNVVAFTEIMQMLWKRLNDHGKNWRHVYKALVLLEYLIKTGTEKVAQQCKENIFAIQTLKDFQYMEGHKDQGINVREKAKQLVALLRDDERLRNERARALKAKERFAQSMSGFGSDGVDTVSPSSDFQEWEPCNLSESSSRHEKSRRSSSSGVIVSAAELEAARPQTVGEEELQLQLALAMSREEAEQEEQRRRSDDVRLQLALSQSQQDFKVPQDKQQSHLLDLIDVDLGEAAAATGNASSSSSSTDPWGMPLSVAAGGGAAAGAAAAAAVPRPQSLDFLFSDFSLFSKQSQNDPWSVPSAPPSASSAGAGAAAAAAVSTSVDPWAPVLPQRPTATVDPWKVPAASPLTVAGAAAPRVDPWAPVSATNSENKSPTPIGFILPTTTSSVTTASFNSNNSNGFNGLGSVFSNSTNQKSSPLDDLDEFDIISNRNKVGTSPLPLNNGNTNTTSPDPFDLRDLTETIPASTGAVKKTPQSFLGENSALVNLDNLVSATTLKNPTPAPAPAFSANPFAPVASPPRPSINQIRQDPWTIGGASSTTPAATANPFLS